MQSNRRAHSTQSRCKLGRFKSLMHADRGRGEFVRPSAKKAETAIPPTHSLPLTPIVSSSQGAISKLAIKLLS